MKQSDIIPQSKEILLLGEMNTGVEAFLNLLLEVPLFRRQTGNSVLPAVKVHAGAKLGFWLKLKAEQAPRELHDLVGIPSDWASIDYLELTIPEHPLLKKGLVLWVPPAINSPKASHREHLHEFLKSYAFRSELVLFFIGNSPNLVSMNFLLSSQSLRSRFRILCLLFSIIPLKDAFALEGVLKTNLREKAAAIPLSVLPVAPMYEEYSIFTEETAKLPMNEILRLWNEKRFSFDMIYAKYKRTFCCDEPFSLLMSIAGRIDRASLPKSDVHGAITIQAAQSDVNDTEGDLISAMPLETVLVEGGTFMMGHGKKDNSSSQPLHSVTLSNFRIGAYPVTQLEWSSVMGTNPSYFKNERAPVESVTWFDAVLFCNKKSLLEGLMPAYTINEPVSEEAGGIDALPGQPVVALDSRANGYRLPSEAEWEYAARGGIKKRGCLYSGSNEPNEVAWFGLTWEIGSTSPVGTKKPNELGIYDMSGNVCEWCWDWDEGKNYSLAPSRNPMGPNSGIYKMLRGGSWNYLAANCFIHFRYRFFPDYQCSQWGFRIARNA